MNLEVAPAQPPQPPSRGGCVFGGGCENRPAHGTRKRKEALDMYKERNLLVNRISVAASSAIDLFGMLTSVCAAFVILLVSPGLFPARLSEEREPTLALVLLEAAAFLLAGAFSIWIILWGNARIKLHVSIVIYSFAAGCILMTAALGNLVGAFGFESAALVARAILVLVLGLVVVLVVGMRRLTARL